MKRAPQNAVSPIPALPLPKPDIRNSCPVSKSRRRLPLLLLPRPATHLRHQRLGRGPARHQLEGLDGHLADQIEAVDDHPRGGHGVPEGLHLGY